MPLVRVYSQDIAARPQISDGLECFIIEGVNEVGAQAVKGTTFRFDCTFEGLNVMVNESQQGTASFNGLGTSLVDVFMHDNAVSPTLVNNCIDHGQVMMSRYPAASLLDSSQEIDTPDIEKSDIEEQESEEEATLKLQDIESKLGSIQE